MIHPCDLPEEAGLDIRLPFGLLYKEETTVINQCTSMFEPAGITLA
jgi:hypothetical protein